MIDIKIKESIKNEVNSYLKSYDSIHQHKKTINQFAFKFPKATFTFICGGTAYNFELLYENETCETLLTLSIVRASEDVVEIANFYSYFEKIPKDNLNKLFQSLSEK